MEWNAYKYRLLKTSRKTLETIKIHGKGRKTTWQKEVIKTAVKGNFKRENCRVKAKDELEHIAFRRREVIKESNNGS